jgi:hypothetical protein
MVHTQSSQNPYQAWATEELARLKRPSDAVLEEACNGIPVRRPKGHGTNIISYIPSRKMNNQMIFAESRRLEQKACYLQELYPFVKAYYSQPYRFRVRRMNCNGVLKSESYVPDYLSVVEDDHRHLHYILVECKMVKSMLERPDRFVRNPDRRWEDREAFPELREKGFHAVIFSDEDTTPILKKNLSLLMPHLRARK